MAEQLVESSLTVDQAKIDLYADITDDHNPIHVDPEFAAKTEMGGVIAHGTMSMNLIWRSVGKTFGQDAEATSELDIRFIKPVRVGDVVTAGGVPKPGQPGIWQVWVKNQNGDSVIEGTVTLAQP